MYSCFPKQVFYLQRLYICGNLKTNKTSSFLCMKYLPISLIDWQKHGIIKLSRWEVNMRGVMKGRIYKVPEKIFCVVKYLKRGDLKEVFIISLLFNYYLLLCRTYWMYIILWSKGALTKNWELSLMETTGIASVQAFSVDIYT